MGFIKEIEIFFPKEPDGNPEREFFVKIDGVKIGPTSGVKVESAMWGGTVYPMITIRLLAHVIRGNVEGQIREEIIPIYTEGEIKKS